jgi:hypothetical protein
VAALPTEFEDQLDNFLSLAGKKVYSNPSTIEFSAWIRQAVPMLFPALLSQIPDDPEEVRVFLGMVARNLYADFPMPALSLQPTGKTKQGRNDPCDCGSGQKFKQCCGSISMPPLFGGLNLLRYVLDAYPKSKLDDVAASKASIDAIADTAYQWMQDGQESRAAALLEPFFKGDAALTGRLAPLFNLLMDVWLTLGRKAKREALIDAILLRGDKVLRSDALQRRTTMLADRGDHNAAWKAFRMASDLNPNDPALSFLEVTTLLSEGRTAEAQGRAQWWAAFLAKQRDSTLAELVERLRSIAKDPQAGMMGVAMDMNTHWNRLNDLFLSAPRPEVRHSFEVFQEETEEQQSHYVADAFVPDIKLTKLEAAWSKTFPQVKPDITRLQHDDDSVWDNASQWLDLLEKHPDLWFSFEVLDDLVMAVDTIHVAGVEERLLVPMAERAAEQLRVTLESATVQSVRCPWGLLKHRPALRPVAHLSCLCKEAGTQDHRKAQRFMELAHWMVFELNPNDNHGLRTDLSDAMVRFERWSDVIAVNNRYPGDMQPNLQLNALLAAFVLEKSETIKQDLKRAAKVYPNAMKMLLGPEPKPVKPDNDYGISIGGKYEAWLYVREMRSFWERHRALDWARSVLSTSGKKAKPVVPGQQSLL